MQTNAQQLSGTLARDVPTSAPTLRVRQLFRDVQEVAAYCERNPDFPARVGLVSALECWEFNPQIPLNPS